jgi:hypothetical protein
VNFLELRPGEVAWNPLALYKGVEGGKVEFISTHGTGRGRDKMIIRKDQAPVVHTDGEDARYYGLSQWLHLSDEGGLTQFGAHLHTLQPGRAPPTGTGTSRRTSSSTLSGARRP